MILNQNFWFSISYLFMALIYYVLTQKLGDQKYELNNKLNAFKSN